MQAPAQLAHQIEINDDARWQAVVERDASLDGLFVYAVASTGIYCRPSCPSRKPGRDQVRFFGDPRDAKRAGFRACRRCRPDGVHVHIELVRCACEYLDNHFEENPSLARLGAALDVSPYHLQRVFKRVTGLTPKQYVLARRTGQLKSTLRERDDVTSSVYEAGFGSPSRVYESARDELGMTPGDYRRGGKGMSISYTVVNTQLGRMLVGTTERGVCAVSLGDSDADLEGALRAEYPEASIARRDEIGPLVEAVVDLLNGDQPHPDLPLDVQATAFQRRVWDELRRIPRGETRSYAEIATAVGQPGAARAVASACAANPVAVVIPCHRVVRSDGEPGGYRWGAQRKTRLISAERG